MAQTRHVRMQNEKGVATQCAEVFGALPLLELLVFQHTGSALLALFPALYRLCF
jgi:hypothetical protein